MQDPVARTVSSHNMMYTQAHRCAGKVCSVDTAPLLQEFRKDRDLNFKWPEDLTGCNFDSVVRTLLLQACLLCIRGAKLLCFGSGDSCGEAPT